MAGAPTARGCDACRKQKKKCDQAKPKCARCTRLDIECVGSGERRYIFKQEQGRNSSTSSGDRSSPEAKLPRRTKPQQKREVVLSRTPSNENTLRGRAFIAILEIEDIRYALSNYGDLLMHLPSRMGRNQGLDAAVNAMTISYGSYRNGGTSQEALASYRFAILALKRSFEDPATALAPETLAAMYLCTIVESFVAGVAGVDDMNMTSAEAMALIMKAAIHLPWKAGFEAEVLTLMVMPVLMDSLFNNKIEIEPWIWTIIEMYEPIRTPGPRVAAPFESLHIKSLCWFAIHMREPQMYIHSILSAYRLMLLDLPELRKALDGVHTTVAALNETSRSWTLASKAFTRIQAAYTMLITMALLSNIVLRLRSPAHLALAEAARDMCSEILRTSFNAGRFRPFGSGAQPFALVAAVVASDDEFVKAQARLLIAEYASDFPNSNWAQVEWQLKARLGIL